MMPICMAYLHSFIGGTPVSYTHLDVYKRQVQVQAVKQVSVQIDPIFLIGPVGCLSAGLFPFIYCSPCLLYTSQEQPVLIFIVPLPRCVSFPNSGYFLCKVRLDVYKRQRYGNIMIHTLSLQHCIIAYGKRQTYMLLKTLKGRSWTI